MPLDEDTENAVVRLFWSDECLGKYKCGFIKDICNPRHREVAALKKWIIGGVIALLINLSLLVANLYVKQQPSDEIVKALQEQTKVLKAVDEGLHKDNSKIPE